MADMDKFESMTDEELLALSQSKPRVFEVLVNRWQAPFLRKSRSILGNGEDGEDAVQDTFVKIYTN